ncbi:MAG: hypothetical protein K6U89_19855, partial [Chloroflexi bacterium]|nr:hypothetical protein [Chloroflexota bacterium]
PVTGQCDFTFQLFDAASGGSQVGNTRSVSSVTVSRGLFTVELDFGVGAFDGTERWLEVGVRCPSGSGSITTLSPRQRLTAVPYALYARSGPYSAGAGLSLAGTQFSLLPSYQLPQSGCGAGQVVQWNGSSWGCATVSGGGGTVTGVTAGSGLSGGGTSGVVALALAGSYQLPQGCSATQVPKWNGGSWQCGADNDTTYSAGAGLSLTGTQFSLLAGYQLPQSCSATQVPRWTGSAWGCENVWFWGGNAGTSAGTNFLGTTDAQALELKVNSQRALRLEPSSGSPNVVGGSVSNTVTSGVMGATIGGGGAAGSPNRVTDDYGVVGGGSGNLAGNDSGLPSDAAYATVGGGQQNTASGSAATVGGGYQNTASGSAATVGGGYQNTASGFAATVGGGYGNGASGFAATVGGGYGNTASGQYATVGGGAQNTASVGYATVGGGYLNGASGGYATVGGGYLNGASGFAATVGGGQQNTAAGDYSFVVGRQAKNSNSAHPGVFLFADSTNVDFPSTAANQFRVRATGGVQFVLGVDGSGNPTWTCSVSSGNSWSCSSDRALKENLVLADGRAVLAQLAGMPLYYWNAKGADPASRHLGPMAQDFFAAFGVGTDDTSIATIDLDGVALAAIQGLFQQQEEQAQRLAALEQQNTVLAAEGASGRASAAPAGAPLLTERLTALEQQNAALQQELAAVQQQNAALEARLAALEQRSSPFSLPFGLGLP